MGTAEHVRRNDDVRSARSLGSLLARLGNAKRWTRTLLIKPPGERDGATVTLTDSEHKEVKRRTALRAAVVFETVRREGEQELERPVASLAFSGLAAGLSMGFSLVAMSMIRAALPATGWRALIENLGYTLGFLIVILGRQQLFTENTVTAMVPLLDDPNKRDTLLRAARLWVVVLACNVAGALLFALGLAHTNAFAPDVKAAFRETGKQTLSFDFLTNSDPKAYSPDG